MVRLTEETRVFVARDDGYPWDEIFQTVVKLHSPSAYALFTRWTELGNLGIRSDIGQLSHVGLATTNFPPNRALGLLRLGWDGRATAKSFPSILDAALAANPIPTPNFRNQLQYIVMWVLRDISREERGNAAQSILDWMKTHRCDHFPEAQPLRDYLTFLAAHAKQDTPTRRHLGSDEYQRAPDKQVDWEQYIGIEPIPARLYLLLTGLRELPGYQSQSTLLGEARQRLRPSERVAYLQALLELPEQQVSAEEYLSEWEICLSEWKHSRTIQQWADTGIPDLARRHLPSILGYPYQVSEYLGRFLRLPFVAGTPWLELLAPALADWVERLAAWQLYALAGALADGLTHLQRNRLLDEAISQGEQALAHRRQQPLPALATWPLSGEDRDTPFARLLYALLGHPDTRIRWSCLHGLRAMALQDDATLLTALVQQLDTETVAGFLPPDTDFLWMSARAYLMIFLARFAQDHPHALLPHLSALQGHALSKTFPHAQIRELAKRTLLTVEEHIPGSLDPHVRQALEALNCPNEVQVTPRYLSDGRRYEGRYNFNSIDTLPYWFTPLGRLFNLSGEEIAVLAEKWICDRWGYSGLREPSYRKAPRNRDWQLSTNRHGSLPIIEVGRLYLEYHAMMLVAGELADSHSTVCGDQESFFDRFDYWLQKHLPTHAKCWLSELREPVPLEAHLHGMDVSKEGWLIPNKPAEFDACLGIATEKRPEFLIVATEVEIHESERQEHHRVESALVSPESAHALLRALQSIGDPTSYRIPPACHDLEIEEPGFSLRGWISERSGEKELDDHDPLLYGLDTGLPLFPQAMMDQLNLSHDVFGKRYVDQVDPSIVVAEVISWSEPHEDKEWAQYSSGWRLQIKIDRLLHYLQVQQRCLILEVQIDREGRSYGEERSYDYKPPAVLLYLLHPNGQLETLEHHHRLGATDS